jgi:hypothetical protein
MKCLICGAERSHKRWGKYCTKDCMSLAKAKEQQEFLEDLKDLPVEAVREDGVLAIGCKKRNPDKAYNKLWRIIVDL